MNKTLYKHYRNIKANSFDDIWRISSELNNDGVGHLDFIDFLMIEELNRIGSHNVEFSFELRRQASTNPILSNKITINVPSNIYEYDDIKNFILDYIYEFEEYIYFKHWFMKIKNTRRIYYELWYFRND